jgi:hypothetical protein
VKSEKVENIERKNGLREIEMEVEAEGREWMRRRLQERLQAEADREGSVFSPERTQGPVSADGMAEFADGGGSSQAQGLVWFRSRHRPVG